MPRQIFDTLLQESKSQLRQDFIALSELDFKMNGYFVEFEATNGIDLRIALIFNVVQADQTVLLLPKTGFFGRFAAW